MFPRTPKDIDETRKFISETIENTNNWEEIVFVILNKDNNEFLWCVWFHNIKDIKEFWIWLKKSAHWYKYWVEACTSVKNWVDKNFNYDYIVYPVVKENIASRKIPESFWAKVMREYSKTMLSSRTYDMVDYWIYKI
jgi:RimJ/RimL family protein N-acetyltransferase